MTKALLILAVLAVCVAVLSRGVSAYQIFSYNPNFDSDISGISVYNEVNQTLYYNDTCEGRTGCLIMSSDGSYSSIYLYALSLNDSHLQWTSATDLSNYDSSTHFLRTTLPRGREGIVVFSYYFNESPENFFQYLAVVDMGTGFSIGNATLNLTAGVWHTATVIVPPSTSNRSVRVFATFRWNNTSSMLMVDKFKFYTMDVTESREKVTIFVNTTQEIETYCGQGTKGIFLDNDGYFIPYFYGNDTGYILVNDSENQDCGIFVLNSTIVARRLVQEINYQPPYPPFGSYTFPFYMMFHAHDPFYFLLRSAVICTSFFGGNCMGVGVVNKGTLFSSIQLRNVIATAMFDPTTDLTWLYGVPTNLLPNGVLRYNGIPVNDVNIAFLGNFSYNTNHAGYPYYLSSINTTPYSTYPNPAGTAWKYTDGVGTDTAYYPFFITAFSVENVGWTCNVVTNNEYFTTSQGEHVNERWCGSCGCTGDGFGYRCVQSTDHWECHNEWEAWHYNTDCSNDLQLICHIRCESGRCVGEEICANSTDCSNYCDGSTLYYNPYCDFSDYNCKWYSNQNCTYGCNSYLKSCNTEAPATPVFQDRSPVAVISEITGGILGFVSFTANPFLSILFIAVVAIIIIGVFSLFAYIAKHIGDI